MKALVTFYSESGNTEKLAKAVYEGISQAEKDIIPIKDVSNVEGYDVIFMGFPVHTHSVPNKAEAFAKKIPEGQKMAYFATHGSMRGGEFAITAFYHALSLVKNGIVLGTFSCRGEVNQQVIDGLTDKPAHRAWAQEAQSAAGHPDEADLEAARDWSRMMMAKTRSYSKS